MSQTVFTIMGNFTTGWSVYNVSARRKLAGPFKGKDGRGKAIDIEMALRRAGSPSDEEIERIVAEHMR